MSALQQLPSIDHLLNSTNVRKLIEVFGRPLSLEAARSVLGDIRQTYINGGEIITDEQEINARMRSLLEAWTKPSLAPVINATGVILHTNLGRGAS